MSNPPPDLLQNSHRNFIIDAGARHVYVVSLKMSTRILKGKEVPMSYSIDLGGTAKGCVQIVVSVQDPSMIDNPNPFVREFEAKKTFAEISWIGYSSKCSVTDDMPSGEGTRHMIRTAMTLVLGTFDWIKAFKFQDASAIECKEGSIANLQLAQNGKTYYERHLNAFILSDIARKKYENSVANFKNAELLPFKLLKEMGMSDDVAAYVKETYSSSVTYPEFFKRLNAKCQEEKNIPFCVVGHLLGCVWIA